MRNLIYEGKSKNVYDRGNGLKEFVFTDRISAMDRKFPTPIPNKGISLCDISCFWFDKFSKEGICHHFVERENDRSIIVKSVDIIQDYSLIIDAKTNHLIPLEFITRHYVAGSLFQRLQNNKIDKKSLGLTDYSEKGTKLLKPFFEVSTKLESVDLLLSKQQALLMAKMSIARLNEIENICFSIDKIIQNEIEIKNIIHVDGKKEFGYDKNGNLMLVDVCGTPDEDRFWITHNGNYIDTSKELLRAWFRSTSLYKELIYTRNNNLTEPKFPNIPNHIVQELSEMYKVLRNNICTKQISYLL